MAKKSDIEITLGLDDENFIKSLKTSDGYAEKKAWQIAKDFERAEQAKERAVAEKVAKMQRSYQRLESANQIATVGMAAGMALVSASILKAAEHNSTLRHELLMLKKSSDSFLSDLGNDLAPTIGSLDTIIDRIGTIRKAASDKLAMFGSNEADINYKRAIQDQDRRNEKRFGEEKQAQDLARQIGGTEDDPDGDFRRSMNEQISTITDSTIKKRLRDQLKDQLAKRKKKREEDAAKKQQSSDQRFRQRSLDDDASLLEAQAARNPSDLKAQQDAIKARAEAKKQQAFDAISNDESLSRQEQLDAIRRQMIIIGKETAKQLEDAQKAAEIEAERQEALERQGRTLLAQSEIELARAEGREKEAEAMALILASEERRQRIREQEGLSDEQRQRLLENEQRLLEAQNAALGTPAETSTPGTIGPGFAGDAITAAQAIGVKSETRELIDVNRVQTALLERIAEASEQETTATVGE